MPTESRLRASTNTRVLGIEWSGRDELRRPAKFYIAGIYIYIYTGECTDSVLSARENSAR